MAECQFHGTCQGLVRECEQLRENDRAVMIELGSVKERIVQAYESTKSAHHRIDGQEEQTKAILAIAIEIKEVSKDTKAILERMERQERKMEDHDDRFDIQEKEIETLKNIPAQNVYAFWKMFLGAVITGLAGLALGHFGIK